MLQLHGLLKPGFLNAVALARRMADQASRTDYKEALKMLDTMVSNHAARSRAVQYPKMKGEQNRALFHQAGISLDQLDSLSVIHIAGTKGKGSTSAMCESILRHCGFKTGLYTSPHLIEVRERIQINRKPLSEEKFARYFWECYDKMIKGKDSGMDAPLPVYFGFLTVMACHVFLQEKVDVLVLEVGLGGEYDHTNVIRSPKVCGVTTLGMDHMEILGNTLEEITWQKAGIFKPGRPAFTVPQKAEATQVLCQRAKEIGVRSLQEAPPLSTYDLDGLALGLSGDHQLVNASLAVQLCRAWMEEEEKWPTQTQTSASDSFGGEFTVAKTFDLSPAFTEGLEQVKWSGRSQTVKQDNVTFYFDAAHNIDSIPVSAKWFKSSSQAEVQAMGSDAHCYKVLIFNVTKDRDSQTFLDILSDCNYDFVLFCPNVMSHDQVYKPGSSHAKLSKAKLMEPVDKNSQIWLELRDHNLKESGRSLTGKVHCFECIACALSWIRDHLKQLQKSTSLPLHNDHVTGSTNTSTHTGSDHTVGEIDLQSKSMPLDIHFQVHITGSSHIVGDTLAQLGFIADEM